MAGFRCVSRLFFSFLLSFILSAVGVIAQSDFFDSFNTITGGSGLAEFYAANTTWIDAIVYFFLFFYVSRFAFSKQDGMRKVAGIMGVALAVGAIVAENTFSFNLGTLGPFALAIALAVLAFAVYKAISGIGLGGNASWAFAYIISYGFLTTAASELFSWINENVPFVGSFIAIGLVIALIAAIMGIFKWAGAGFRSGTAPAREHHGESAAEHEKHTKATEEADDVAKKTVAAETAEDKESAEHIKKAEELEKAALDDLEKIKEFLEKLRNTHLTPDQAKEIGKKNGDALKRAIRAVLTYSEQANALIDAANHLNYARIKHIRRVLQREAGISPRDKKNPHHIALEKHLQFLVAEAWKEVKETDKIKNELKGIEEREKDATKFIDEFVAELLKGMPDRGKAEGLINSSLAAVDAAQKGLQEIEGFEKLVRTEIENLNPKLEKKIVDTSHMEKHDAEISRHRGVVGI